MCYNYYELFKIKYFYNDKLEKLSINVEELNVKSCRVFRSIIDGYIIRYDPKEFKTIKKRLRIENK